MGKIFYYRHTNNEDIWREVQNPITLGGQIRNIENQKLRCFYVEAEVALLVTSLGQVWLFQYLRVNHIFDTLESYPLPQYSTLTF